MAQMTFDTNPDPVALAAELRPLLARNAAQAEHDRRLPAENVEAIDAANLFKVMTPKRWGGFGAPLSTVLRTLAKLGEGCGSSGWVTMILGGCSWYASLLPDRGQEEIFGDGGNSRICGSTPPMAQARRVDGGVRISGRFPFASGCWHAAWAILVVPVEDNSQKPIDQVAAFAHMSELEIEDTWFVAGMCGTGSNTLVAHDVFVPDHRTYSAPRVLNGERPGHRHFGEPSDNYAFMPANCLVGLSPVIGIAQAMLDEVIAGARKRGITFTSYTRQADAPVVQHRVAEAALKIESAGLQALNAADEVHETAVAGRQMEYLARARVRGMAGYAARLLQEAVDALISIGGASGFADSSPLQRMWRDANIATRHAFLATDPNVEIYGRALLGGEGNITPLI
jgi:3-hydroxy-9,10-secoandrosta-1,3,5(10)-triene-9,17-dione monooxygenase